MNHRLGWCLVRTVLWLPIVIYAVQLTRSFFQQANAAIYLSTDDAVANISYALAEHGRYGFLSSPILEDLPRYQGLFSYGPYYFYLGAALVWLFGYSLTVLRAIHLAIVLGIAGAACKWFGRGWSSAAGALTAVGLLVAFERAQWPMVRPDSMVSLFAIALVLCAGAAIRTGRAAYWVGVGLAAACGAFSHLVAWSLVPAAILLWLVGLAATARADRDQIGPRGLRALAALAAGGLSGAWLFYASFGFRFRDQYLFITGYQEITGSMGAMKDPAAAFWELVLRHFAAAYWYLPYPLEYAVWATMLAGIVAVPLSLWRREPDGRNETLALVAPPVIVWVAYLLSLGVFNNFHSGYAMLNQVMWLWTGGALVATVPLHLSRWPAIQKTVIAGAWAVALGLGWGAITFLAQRTDYRALAAAAYAPIDEYVSQVLDPIPAGATSWGSVVFGIEHPNRLQLVQFSEAVALVEHHAPAARAALSPDYVVWGYYENRDHALQVIAGRSNPFGDKLLLRMAEALPGIHYTLVAMTAGSPYGVTRVYARSAGALPLDAPMVAVHDPQRRQWNRVVGAAVPVSLVAAPPARLHVGAEGASTSHTAVQTLTGEWPVGTYLIRISLSADLKPTDAVAFMAGGTADLRDAFGDFGPTFDLSPWLAGERSVHLLYTHPGGPVQVSQFGAVPAMTGVEARPVLALPDFSAARRPVPPEHALASSQWEASFPEVTVTPQPDRGTVAITGNTVQYGYQAYGPKIPVEPGVRIRLRVPVTVSAGSACIGVLDGTGMRWLVAPDRLSTEYEFVVNDSRTVMPVLANCSSSPVGIVPIQAVIGDGSYAMWPVREELYVDQLMREFRNASPR